MADAKAGLFQKLIKNPQVMKIAEQMYNSMGNDQQFKFLSRPNFKTYISNSSTTGSPNFDDGLLSEALLLDGLKAGNAKSISPDGTEITSVGGQLGHMMSQGGSFGDLGSLALGAAKAHPFKTAGLVGLGAGNLGGLTDNDKFGGQLAGLGLGGLGAHMMASGNPYLAAMMTMGGGALGSLFDKLRAKKEQEQQGVPNPMMNRR